MSLPSLDEQILNSSSYYDFPEERLLFVNLERDFGRVAPLAEAAVSYSARNKCYFLNFHLSSDLGEYFRDRVVNFLQGKIISNKVTDYLRLFDIKCLSTGKLKKKKTRLTLTENEIQYLFQAKKNEMQQSQLDLNFLTDWLKSKEFSFSFAIEELISIIENHKIDRLFVWNGRFVLSTLVKIASSRAKKHLSCIEFGSEINQSFEVFRSRPTDHSDLRARVNAREHSSEARLVKQWSERQIIEWVLSRKENEFTSKFTEASKIEFDFPFITLFLTSLWEMDVERTSFSQGSVSQEQAVILLSEISRELQLKLVLRVHPNPSMPNYEIFETEYWRKFVEDSHLCNCVIVPANSTLSSYLLADHSKYNFVYASFIGLELIFRKIPTFFFAMMPWDKSSDVRDMHYFDHAIRSFLKKPLVIEKSETYPFIRYLLEFGFSFKYMRKDKQGYIYFGDRILCRERNTSSFIVKLSLKLFKLLQLGRIRKILSHLFPHIQFK